MMAICPAGQPKLIQPSFNQNNHASRKLIWLGSVFLSEAALMEPNFLLMMLLVVIGVAFSFYGELGRRSDLIGSMAGNTILHGSA